MAKDEKSTVSVYFDEQYELYRDSIYKFCMAKLNCDADTAEDCTQETFMVFYNRLKQGETFENPRAFLYKTASNHIKRVWEKMQKQMNNETSMDEALPQLATNIDELESKLDYDELRRRINSLLNKEELMLFEMKFIENIRIKDIAETLGIKPTACSTKLMRIRSKLKTEIMKGAV